MTQLLTLALPFPVSVNAAYRNVLHVGRVKTTAYKNWLAAAQAAVLQDKVKGRIEGLYTMEIEVDRPDRRRRDLSNLIKTIEDFCVSMGFVEDDSLCERLQIKWTAPIEGRPGPVRVWLIATQGDVS